MTLQTADKSGWTTWPFSAILNRHQSVKIVFHRGGHDPVGGLLPPGLYALRLPLVASDTEDSGVREPGGCANGDGGLLIRSQVSPEYQSTTHQRIWGDGQMFDRRPRPTGIDLHQSDIILLSAIALKQRSLVL